MLSSRNCKLQFSARFIGTLLAIAKQKPRRNLYQWIQFSLPNFGPGNNAALTINPTIGCSRALVPRARTLTGRISFYPASSGLPQRELEFESMLAGTRSAHSFSHDIDRKRERKRESCARTYAALELPRHAGNLFSGQDSGKAGRSTSADSDDRPVEGATHRSARTHNSRQRQRLRVQNADITKCDFWPSTGTHDSSRLMESHPMIGIRCFT